MDIELDGPYQSMYEELVEEYGKEAVESDIKTLVQNSIHESYQSR